MRPVPIPDELVEGALRRVVVAAPDGDLTNEAIAPVEALFGIDPEHGPIYAVLVTLEPGDLERLTECGGIWLSMMTPQLVPFSLAIADGQDQ